jgi:colanic acid biosynthesis glycosyl transferase WcaI
VRILIYGLNYAPELVGIGKYTGDLVGWLAGREHDVSVVTAPPYYPNWCVWRGFSAFKYRRESDGPVNVWRCPLWVPRSVTGVKRIVHLLSFALSSIPVLFGQAVSQRPDVILVVAPAFFCAPFGWLAARLVRAKCWLHIQDFEVDAAFQLGIVDGGKMKRAVAWLERWVLRRFDAVSSISRRMVARLALKGVAVQRTFIFPNWVDTSAIFPSTQFSEGALRESLGLAQGTTVVI